MPRVSVPKNESNSGPGCAMPSSLKKSTKRTFGPRKTRSPTLTNSGPRKSFDLFGIGNSTTTSIENIDDDFDFDEKENLSSTPSLVSVSDKTKKQPQDAIRTQKTQDTKLLQRESTTKKRQNNARRRTASSKNPIPKPTATRSDSRDIPQSQKEIMPSPSSNHNIPATTRSSHDDVNAHQSSSSSTSPPPSSSPLTGMLESLSLGVDTRVLESFSGDAAGRVFLSHVKDFLRRATRRGAPPKILGTSYLDDNIMKGKAISVRSGQNDKMWDSIIVPLAVKDDGGYESDMNPPVKLKADESWKLFEDLVNKIIMEKTKKQLHSLPLNLTILTSDVAFFSDNDPSSHIPAFQRFYSQIRPYFESNYLRSVTLVVVETGISRLEMDTAIQTTKCLRELNSQTSQLLKNEFGCDSSRGRAGQPVTVRLSAMECNTIAFGRLSRKWLRDVINGGGNKGRMTFNLPETMDGSVCTIILDLELTVLPFAITSFETTRLILDMRRIVECTVEVIQIVPLGSVDASLMYGVPTEARAGMENDYLQYRDMQILVKQLWTWLSANDCGLILRCIHNGSDNNERVDDYFLLMAEENVGNEGDASKIVVHKNTNGRAPECGMMFRYAMEEQLLRDVVEEGDANTAESHFDTSHGNDPEQSDAENIDLEETNKQYYEYIDRSLEILERGGVNPIVLGMKMASLNEYQINEDDDNIISTEKIDSRWAEESGVGVASRVDGLEEDVCTNEEQEDSLRFNQFDYE